MSSISQEAIDICHKFDLIDLHLDILIPYRLWGYSPFQENKNLFGRHFFGHSDIPRMNRAGISGAMWSITTNPFRPATARWNIFQQNISSMLQLENEYSQHVKICTNYVQYQQGKHEKKHCILPAIQGGNALSAAPDGIFSIPNNLITRITLVHLTPSNFGNTSSPFHWLQPNKGLTDDGKKLIEQMNEAHIFLDLAHVYPQTFWDSIDVHNKEHPLLVTHTGVQGKKAHWRNLDDQQIKAIADRNGVIGIMFACNFLQQGKIKDSSMVLEHLEHLINVGGENIAALGSDFDGAITAPTDLYSAEQYPILVQRMLERGWSSQRIENIMGKNFLRVFAEYRP